MYFYTLLSYSAYPDEEVESFYDLLNTACEENRGTWNLVLGDFNAKLGTRQPNDSYPTLGQFGLGDRNVRGTRLIHFAFGQNLYIGNSFFAKKPQRRWTWVAPNRTYKNEIDFVLSSDRSIVKDVSVINKINYSSDHRPVRAKIKFNFKIHRLKHFQSKITKHSKHSLVKNSDQFNLELTNQFSSLRIENSSKTIKVSRKNKTKLSTQTKSLIAKRADLDIYTTEFRSVDRAVKRSIRRDIRSFNLHLVQTAIEKHTSLRTAKQGITRGKQWINGLQDQHGKKQNSRDKIMEICTDFYKTLYSD
ncbi:Endonuclease-reverse transcriptase, partial [Operophtera brumata]